MQYLSDAWFAAADAAVRGAGPAPSGPLTIVQQVDGVGAWKVTLGASPEIRRFAPGVEEAADATFRQTAETARRIARGETDAHQAFLLGDISFDGDITRLIEHRAALDWLEAALAPVMAATEWPQA
ncbi:MAG: hypothetical protein AAF567_10780 [Actinomycetota bacterium]